MPAARRAYAAVADSDLEHDEVDGFLEKPIPYHTRGNRRPSGRRWLAIAPWILCAVLSSLLLFLLLERRNVATVGPGESREAGSSTEFCASTARRSYCYIPADASQFLFQSRSSWSASGGVHAFLTTEPLFSTLSTRGPGGPRT